MAAFGPPQSPAILSITQTQLYTILVTWVAGHDGGFDQTFTLDIKEASDDDSNYVTKMTLADPGHRNNVTSLLADLKIGVNYTLKLASTSTKPLFQKRMDDSVDFYRDWNDYKYGFGNLSGEHWLGNNKMYLLTSQDDYELRVDMEDAAGIWAFAQYDHFGISSEATKYRLRLGNYSGNA
ncbi:fibroleukin-like, partial [Lingula anatina]|uniref:Fibroleukin-like n=1 Tax=Lingula anatina TaxID=7574 RepID=A0A1S3JHG4_LINAN